MRKVLEKILATIILCILLMASSSIVLTYAYDELQKITTVAEATLETRATTYKIYVRDAIIGGSKYSHSATYSDTYYDGYGIGSVSDNSIARFCLRAGTMARDSYNTNYGTYNIKMSYNAINANTTLSDGTNLFANTTSTNYNALNWLIDNIYNYCGSLTTKERATQRKIMLTHLADITKEDGRAVTYDQLAAMGDGLITTVEQLVIWNVTNSPEVWKLGSDESTVKTFFAGLKCDGSKISEEKATAATNLYLALYRTAYNKNGKRSTMNMPVQSEASSAVTVNSSNAQITSVEGEENTYIVGPITVKAGNYRKSIEDSLKVLNDNESLKILKYTKDNEGKEEIHGGVNAALSQKITQFYIKFQGNTKTQNNSFTIDYNVKVNYKPTISDKNIYVYMNSTAVRQPILEIDKQVDQYSKSDNTNISYNAPKKFDLALTKEIAQIYRYNGSEFLRVYDSTTTKEKDTGTDKSDNIVYEKRLKSYNTGYITDKNNAYYNMNKTPVTVLPGDIIRYKITVYNEGKVNGIVYDITDYLPKGLELVKNAGIATNSGDYTAWGYATTDEDYRTKGKNNFCTTSISRLEWRKYIKWKLLCISRM